MHLTLNIAERGGHCNNHVLHLFQVTVLARQSWQGEVTVLFFKCFLEDTSSTNGGFPITIGSLPFARVRWSGMNSFSLKKATVPIALPPPEPIATEFLAPTFSKLIVPPHIFWLQYCKCMLVYSCFQNYSQIWCPQNPLFSHCPIIYMAFLGYPSFSDKPKRDIVGCVSQKHPINIPKHATI